MDRRGFIRATACGLLAKPVTAFAQEQAANAQRVGFLASESASNQTSRLEALRAGLRELGYVEGKSLVIEVRWAEGKYDRLPALTTELVNLRVAVIVASGAKATRAATRATTAIPIVIETGDAVSLGAVTNLARPEGNVTGWTYFGPEITAKRLELLKECMPRITQVAFLNNPADPSSSLHAIQDAANAMKVALRRYDVDGPANFEKTFAAITQAGCEAVVIQGDTMFAVNGKAIADLAIKHRLPSAGIIEYADAGGLIGNGVDLIEAHRRLALYVDKILKGAKPRDLPVEQATNFELVINAKTAKAIGVSVPQTVLLRANRVIQ
jgi:putative ABC transport system substrate-binding protein